MHVELYFCGLVCMIAGNTMCIEPAITLLRFFSNSDTVRFG